MGMIPMTLANAARKEVDKQVEAELAKILEAFEDLRLEDNASITIKLDFKRKVEGREISPFVVMNSSVKSSLPGMKTEGIVYMDKQANMFMTESVMDNAKEPGLELSFASEKQESETQENKN